MSAPAAGAGVPDDVAALAPLLGERVGELGGMPRILPLGQGQSNPTFRLEGPGGQAVLRVQPPGDLLKGAHAVDREYRVMKALAPTRVPVPRVMLLGEAGEGLDRKYVVMELIEGVVHWDPAIPGATREQRAAIHEAMVTVLADLHSVDVDACGLGDYGRPGNYFARQIATWERQYRQSETARIPDIERLIGWLGEARLPPDAAPALVHGDFRIDNMVFAASGERVCAVLDWELSTLGHPYADLAYQCMQWRLPHDSTFKGLGGIDRARLGIPSEEAYVAAYCRKRGLPGIENWTFCLAFSFFRLAAILQGVYKRHLDGNAANAETARHYGRTVPVLARLACEAIEAS
ncbi:phosphotransferase family protein [Stappia sp.]|uniref:phosphotransferase family protein n=1 Tax=Stappia sp. TaxID=1870903 RepID=UPI0025DE8EB5|nr:phosphotransferase family protein [Stappia sp.]